MFRFWSVLLIPLISTMTMGCGAEEVSAQPTPRAVPAPIAAEAKAVVGQIAPDFTLPDVDGKSVKLSQFKGKTVVLEWFNPGCPFIQYAHGEGPLKEMPKSWAQKGVVWLTINSNAPGTQGHGVDANKAATSQYQLPSGVLLDPSGEVGKAYGAQTTPHMYVISPEGVLVYNGAVDNAPMGKINGTDMEPWLEQVLTAVNNGQPAPRSASKAYGCSVKYKN